ncbi:MAG: hypothetical protein K9L30_06575 [Desulfobacterales bacterium]|nr:hypothetical protein [Desulfobacterales bacterium]
MKTENLAILFTDIVGYTEKTSNISRKAHERLMASHDRILLPVLKKFRGRLIQRIGDAFLMVFKSPTDAMLCGMAMQDAVFEFNQNVEKDVEIHIRVAASLGEVRVAQKDIFGEQVNITARIEGITPPDEIYFSDAIYMAMNKAEVPTEEVGWMNFKGIADKCRVWKIPRFSTLKLVPTDKIDVDHGLPPLTFPFGGAHKRDSVLGKSSQSIFDGNKQIKIGLYAVLALLVVVLSGVYFLSGDGPDTVPPTEQAVVKLQPEKLPVPDNNEAAVILPKDEPAAVDRKTEPVATPAQPGNNKSVFEQIKAKPQQPDPLPVKAEPQQTNQVPVQIKPQPTVQEPIKAEPQQTNQVPVQIKPQPKVQEPPPVTLSVNAPPPPPVQQQSQPVQYTKPAAPVTPVKKVDPEVAKWSSKLRSSDPGEIREGAKYLYKLQGSKPELLSVASEELLKGFRSAEGRLPVDAMAWLCKAIGVSGNRSYTSTLDKVAREATQPNLKKYAVSSMILMEKMDLKNGKIDKAEYAKRVKAIQGKY